MPSHDQDTAWEAAILPLLPGLLRCVSDEHIAQSMTSYALDPRAPPTKLDSSTSGSGQQLIDVLRSSLGSEPSGCRVAINVFCCAARLKAQAGEECKELSAILRDMEEELEIYAANVAYDGRCCTTSRCHTAALMGAHTQH